MGHELLAFSGSPIPNSNLDAVLKEILAATDLPAEFIKLSQYRIKPCIGCLKCAGTNRCVQKDDMNELLDKISTARGIVVGGFPTFFSLNALTKTFLERWYPLKHRYMLTAGKYGIAVAIGFRDNALVEEYLVSFFNWFKMPIVGSMSVQGNVPCLSCGLGEECAYSNVPLHYGTNKISQDMFCGIAEKKPVMERVRQLGKALKEKLG